MRPSERKRNKQSGSSIPRDWMEVGLITVSGTVHTGGFLSTRGTPRSPTESNTRLLTGFALKALVDATFVSWSAVGGMAKIVTAAAAAADGGGVQKKTGFPRALFRQSRAKGLNATACRCASGRKSWAQLSQRATRLKRASLSIMNLPRNCSSACGRNKIETKRLEHGLKTSSDYRRITFPATRRPTSLAILRSISLPIRISIAPGTACL